MKTIRFSTKIAATICGILLIVSLLTAHAERPAPGPTLQDVLNAITTLQSSVSNVESSVSNIPSPWYQILPSAERFILVLGGVAVLDRETGLVWEQSPSATTSDWPTAQYHCNNLTLGNRKGWRLPTVQELASLMDPSVLPPGPTLPSGHPFNVEGSIFWSATIYASATPWNTITTWYANFYNAYIAYTPSFEGSGNHPTWCVRGGQVVDPQ